jgi:hypothetical protein
MNLEKMNNRGYQKGDKFYTATKRAGEQVIALCEIIEYDEKEEYFKVLILEDNASYHCKGNKGSTSNDFRKKKKDQLFPVCEGYEHVWGKEGFKNLNVGDAILIAHNNQLFKEKIVAKTEKQAKTTSGKLIRYSGLVNNFITIPKYLVKSN